MNIIIALVIFSVIILFHELGHFLLAKRNGIAVTEFSLGMGPRIISFTKGETKYSWKLFPFGGSCAMLGEDGEEMCEGAFNTKSVGARISVVAAGPIFNFIFAFFAAAIILSVIGYDPAEVYYVEEGSPAAQAGLMEGDLITRFQGEKVEIARDILMYESLEGLEPGDQIAISYERDGKEYDITFMPETYTKYLLGFTGVAEGNKIKITNIIEGFPMSECRVKDGDYLTSINGSYFESFEDWQTYLNEYPMDGSPITFTFERDGLEYEETLTPEESTQLNTGFIYNTGRVKTTPLGVLKYSFIEVKYWIGTTLKSLGMLVTGKFGVQDLSGPVGVVNVIGDTYEEVKSEGALMIWMNMLNLMILLSANLGVMNLLPIPALDGGRLVFLIIEAIRGKAIDREKEGMIHFAGLVLLMLLMVFVMYQDILRLF